jgi:hypothetical protein
MASQLSNAILAQMSPTEYQPSQPGGPNYIGAADYPTTVYQGYIGSTNYIYEPRATGYDIIDSSKAMFPVAKMPKTDEYKELNLRTTTSPILGECSVPSFFQESEDIVRRCNTGFSQFVFKGALLFNLFVSILMYKKWSSLTIGLFVVFHILLYYFLTRTYVDIAIGEWMTVQKYKYYIKKNIDYTIFDSPIKQFNEINQYMNQQTINRRQILQYVLTGSILFVWFPFFLTKE